MISMSRLPSGPNVSMGMRGMVGIRRTPRRRFGIVVDEKVFNIEEAPVQTLPSYIIPGNIKVLTLGPAGYWYTNNGVISIAPNETGGWGVSGFSWELLTKTLGIWGVALSGDTMYFSIMIGQAGWWQRQGDVTINFNFYDGTFSGQIAWAAGGSSDVEYSSLSGRKDPIELFVPLSQQASSIPYIQEGLTITENAQQILMQQGVSRQPVVAGPLHPSPYIQPGNVMVIPVDSPLGLWDISYVVSGITNTGQIEIAQVQGKLIGRMITAGARLYGMTIGSGGESISNIQSSGNALSFVRDYTRQTWTGIISGSRISGTYGGGPSAGGGTWEGQKQPMEIFIPTDITEYTEKIVITKEMPIATLIPIETVSGKATGQVVVEEGFAPTQEQAMAMQKEVESTLAIQNAPASLSPVSEVIGEIGKITGGVSGISPWIFIIGGGLVLMMMRGKRRGGENV